MNAKKFFTGRLARFVGVTLALLIVFGAAASQFAVNASSVTPPDPPTGGAPVPAGVNICELCNKPKMQADRDLLTGSDPYYYLKDNVWVLVADGICGGQSAECAVDDCHVLVKDCDGGATDDACTTTGHAHIGTYCQNHCEDCHKNLHTCEICGKNTCIDTNCTICKTLDKCIKTEGHEHIIVTKCPDCGGYELPSGADPKTGDDFWYVKTNSPKTYEQLTTPCDCLTCSICDKVIIFKNGKPTANACTEHLDKNGKVQYCKDCCTECKKSLITSISPEDGEVAVGKKIELPFTVNINSAKELEKLDIVGEQITVKDKDGKTSDGLKVLSNTITTADRKGNLVFRGDKVGTYTVTVPVKATPKEGSSETRNAVFTVEVYDGTKLPDGYDKIVTAEIKDVSEKTKYEAGKALNFSAVSASSDTTKATIKPLRWSVALEGKDPYENGEFTNISDGKASADIKKLKSGKNTLTVYYEVTDKETGRVYTINRSVTFTVKKSSGGTDGYDTADTTNIYMTAFIVSLCVVSLTVIGMAAYLKRKNGTMRPAYRHYR